MTSKPPPPSFFPAPRPRPINEPGMTQALNEATRDLGFSRPTSAAALDTAPDAAMSSEPPTAPSAVASNAVVATPKVEVRSRPAPKGASKKTAPAPEADSGRRSPSLRIEINDQLWDALRLEALKRRVTVKYLVFEALAAKGFEIDMNAIPEDGRRAR